jgi:polar amino acid transport system permease protein
MGFSAVFANIAILINGFVVTIQLSIIAIVLGTLLGSLLGILRALDFRILSGTIRAYVAVFRGTPLLMQLFFAFFGLPMLGFDVDRAAAAVVALTSYSGAYISEIVYGGIIAVAKDQGDAAKAVGLSFWQMMRFVVLPQAMVVTLAPLVSWYIGVVKDTTVASVIGYTDLLRNATAVVAVTNSPFETYLVTAGFFFLLTVPMGRVVAILEARTARGWQ